MSRPEPHARTAVGLHCSRCHEHMRTRTWSYFMNQFICMACSHGEATLIADIVQRGADPDQFEACGYVPSVDLLVPPDAVPAKADGPLTQVL